MPQNYTVKQGDTLSKIASQYGVPTSQISGYKSGNPNLIYPGEQLVIPTPEPVQPVKTVQPTVNATGLTGEPPIDTSNLANQYVISTTSSYAPDIEALRGLQTEALKGATGLTTPGLIETANQYGYLTNTQRAEALQPEINALNQQLVDLGIQEQRAIGQYINANVSQGFSLGMEGRIKRQYAIEKAAVSANLGVKVALAEAYQGNADRALSTAEKIVSDLNAKNTQKRQDMEMFYNYYGDIIDSLTEKEKTELENAREDIIRQEEYGREDYTKKTTALMNAAANGLDVSAISGDDIANKSYEDITTMISNAAQKKLAQDRAQELALKRAGGGSGLTDYQRLTSLNSIRSQARQDAGIKLFTTSIQPSYNGASDAAAMGNSTGDIALMRYIAKLTDPTTGVREEEYKTFKRAQGALQNMGVQFTKGMIGRGQLTTEGRKQLLSIATNLYNNAKSQYEDSYSFYDQQAQALGFDPGTVSPSYTKNVKKETNITNSGTTVMTAPDGKQWSVPNNQIELFKQNGYK